MNEYMKIAQEEAQKGFRANKGGPFGACVVKNGKVIGKGCNMVVGMNNPTLHAEIVAITEACKNIGTYDLKDCEIYTTSFPCPMCLSAIIWANIKNVFYGNSKEDVAKIGFRDDFIYEYVHKLYLQRADDSVLKLKKIDAEETLKDLEEYSKKEDKIIY